MKIRKLWMVSAAFALAAAAHVGTASSNGCPPPQPYQGVCAQVIVWAKDPATGMCCQYPTPCSVPAGWQIYYGPDCSDFPPIEGL